MDKDIFIQTPVFFDSKKFYSYYFLGRINAVKLNNDQNLFLDFSNTRRIDPAVIPNLLIMGKRIQEDFGKKAILYLPDTLEMGYIKKYMDQIGFIDYVIKFDLYDFLYTPYGGQFGKEIDPLCRTVYFDGNRERSSYDSIRARITQKIKPFADKYLSSFEHFEFSANGEGDYKNSILEIIYEMNKNCLDYSGSASFTTAHSRYKDNTINISISDIGRGFRKSFIDKKNDCDKELKYSDYQLQLLEKNYDDELTAIIDGINWQKKSKIYGLSGVIREILRLHGIVRIHSNDTMVVFTEEYIKDLEGEALLSNERFRSHNVIRNIKFDGVHVEIVIPLERRKND